MKQKKQICPTCGVFVTNLKKHLRRKRCEKQHNPDYKKHLMRGEI